MDKSVKARLGSRKWRMNNLYWIINEHAERVKFKPNWAQQRLLEGMWYFTMILKARQLGITTFWAIFALDMCLFNSNTKAGIIAHTREDAEEIFQDKVKYPYENLGTNKDGELIFHDLKKALSATQDTARKLMFSNNSSIRVATSMRSATLAFLHITEHGKICARNPEKAREIKTGSLNTVHEGQMVVNESTAEGREGDFYTLCKKAMDKQKSGQELSKLDFKFFFFPWWENPSYSTDGYVIIPQELHEYFDELEPKIGIKLTDQQKSWYALKYDTQQDLMKQEFPSTPEEAFEYAIIGSYYAKQMSKMRTEKRIGLVPHDPTLKVYTGWDIGMDDEMVIWFFQMEGKQQNFIDYYENRDEDIVHYIQVMNEKGYLYADHFFPHDINKKDAFVPGGKNRIEVARNLGLNVIMIPRTPNIVEDINFVRQQFSKVFIDQSKCAQGIKCLDHYRKRWNEKNGCFLTEPLHDWSSNGADGFRTSIHGAQVLTEPAPEEYTPSRTYNQPQGWMR